MTAPMDKALDAVSKMAPQDNRPSLSPRQHYSLSAEFAALQDEKREAIECLRKIVTCARMNAPRGTNCDFIIDGETMKTASKIVSRYRG